jgi:hypothetical protein
MTRSLISPFRSFSAVTSRKSEEKNAENLVRLSRGGAPARI